MSRLSHLFNKLRNKIRGEDRPHLKRLLAALHEIVHRYKSLEAHLEYFEARLRETDATIRDIQTRNEKHLNKLQSRVDELTKAISQFQPEWSGGELAIFGTQEEWEEAHAKLAEARAAVSTAEWNVAKETSPYRETRIDLEYGANMARRQLRTLRAQANKYARAYYDQGGDRINIDEWLRA